jgi:alkaline phosphatase D
MQEPSVDRRDLLRTAAAAAGLLWLPRGTSAQQRWTSNPFSLGVASGSPAPDSVVLWTRLLPARGGLPDGGRTPLPVLWEVAHDEGFTRIAQRGETLALPQLGHSVHVEAPGLEPDRWYFFRFHAGDATSDVGRTRTLPAPDAMAARLRVAYASCQRWEHGFYSAWRHVREDAPDLVLFLGDYIYEYPVVDSSLRGVGRFGWVKTLPQYRDRYALHRSDPALQAAHAACPWLVTWDDHEVQNDYAGVHEGDDRPAGLNLSGDFAARRAAAYQAFYEHMPVRASAFARALTAGSPGGELRLYERFRFGRLADLLVLDNRQYRDRQVCAPPGRTGGITDPAACAAWNDPQRTLLGPAQEAWLDRMVAEAGGGWTVFGQQTVFGGRDFRRGPGEIRSNDGWDGYPVARRRLTDALQRRRVANPVFFGGDIHEHFVGHVKADYADPRSAAIGTEFCGTSISSRPGRPERMPGLLEENPHFVYGESRWRGYGLAEFTPGKLVTTLRAVEDVAKPDSGAFTLATFQVEAGRHRIEKA